MPGFNSKQTSSTTSTGTQGQSVQSNGNFATAGDAQVSNYILRVATTNATPASLLSDGTTSTAKITLTNNKTMQFTADIVGLSDAGASGGYRVSGVIERRGSVASTAIVGSVTVTTLAEDTAGWDVTAVADTTNGALDIQVTGAAATNVRWVAGVKTVEVTY